MATKTEFCAHCNGEQPVHEDKPWLPTVCLSCGRDV